MNNRCEIETGPLLPFPTTKPKRSPPYTALEIILLRTSITIIKSKGNKGSPYLKPLVLAKKPEELPLLAALPLFNKISYFSKEKKYTLKLKFFYLIKFNPHRGSQIV